MIFKTRHNMQKLDDVTVKLRDYGIDRVKETVFLRIILDEHLSWKSYINNFAGKISRLLDIIYKSSFFLNKSALRSLYLSLIYPYLIYRISVWGSTYPSNIKRVVILQKRSMRTISKFRYDAHTGLIFKELNLLPFHDLYLAQIGKMFQNNKGMLPNSFDKMFLLTNQVHSYNIRSANSFYVPK